MPEGTPLVAKELLHLSSCPEKAGEAILKPPAMLPQSELKEVVSARSRLPTWMAQEISALLTDG